MNGSSNILIYLQLLDIKIHIFRHFQPYPTEQEATLPHTSSEKMVSMLAQSSLSHLFLDSPKPSILSKASSSANQTRALCLCISPRRAISRRTLRRSVCFFKADQKSKTDLQEKVTLAFSNLK